MTPGISQTLLAASLAAFMPCVVAAAEEATSSPRVVEVATAPDEFTAAESAEAPGGSPWSFTLTPFGWGISAVGQSTTAGVTTDIGLNLGDILNDLKGVVFLDAEARYDRVGIRANYFWTNIAEGASFAKEFRPLAQLITGSPGIDFKVDALIQINQVEGSVFFRAAEYQLGLPKPRTNDPPPSVALEPYAGARWTSIIVKVDAKGGPDFKATQDWVEPVVGLRTLWTYDDQWNAQVTADLGGFGLGSDISFRVLGVVGYRFGLFGKRDANLQVGYKALYQDYSNGTGVQQFAWKMLFHGPIGGLSITF